MFKPEIVAEIKLRQDSETKEIADSLSFVKEQIIASLEVNESAVAVSKKDLSSLVSGYNQKISAVNDSISALNLRLPHEIKGPGGISGIAGDGPVAQGIRESITSLEKQRDQIIRERNDAVLLSPEAANEQFALAELEKARLRSEKEIARIDTLEREMVQKVLARPVNGLSFMLEVLNDIAGRNFIIWAVFFMFFFIEGIPVLLKFFSKVDSFIYLRALDILKKRKDSAEIASASADSIREIQQAHIS